MNGAGSDASASGTAGSDASGSDAAESASGQSAEGRAAHQGPEVDGVTTLTGLPDGVRVGDLVSAKVVASDGVDLIAEFAALVSTPSGRPAANLTA
ncbi:hypothetical protein [Kribbella sp. NPDC050459]|uniref:hypothetical protein n=1 Tax=Kribbella sp. NPDC050459 TaxID=3155785 RepID=UPI0033F276A7